MGIINPQPNWQTDLELIGMGVTLYSARGLNQTCEPIAASQDLRRTVNGKLIDCSDPIFRKYRTVITCTDQSAPAFGGLHVGAKVTVHCVFEFGYDAYGAQERPAVPNSEREAGGFAFYRPILECLVVAFSIQEDEWGAQTGWTLELEEE